MRLKAVPIVGDAWGKFRRELKLFETFEIHTRMLGWDDKWSFLEHRFVKDGRTAGVVVMRGVFRAAERHAAGAAGERPRPAGTVAGHAGMADRMVRQLRRHERPAAHGRSQELKPLDTQRAHCSLQLGQQQRAFLLAGVREHQHFHFTHLRIAFAQDGMASLGQLDLDDAAMRRIGRALDPP
jgi:hypothetical protein